MSKVSKEKETKANQMNKEQHDVTRRIVQQIMTKLDQ